VDRAAVETYLKEVDLPAGHHRIRKEAETMAFARHYRAGLADCLTTMWDLAMEILGKGRLCPMYAASSHYRTPARAVEAGSQARRVAELLNRAGFDSHNGGFGSVDHGAANASRPWIGACSRRRCHRLLRQSECCQRHTHLPKE